MKTLLPADLLGLLSSRRSVRTFKKEAPSREMLERLIEAAVTAPSASNKQPWRFLIVQDRAVIARLADAVREGVESIASHIEAAFETSFRAYGNYFTRFEFAPVVIVALCRSLTVLSNMIDEALPAHTRANIADMEDESGLIGVSMALQNLLLMAHAMGLGASGMTGPLIAENRIREMLDVPASWHIAAFVPVGWPAETPKTTTRKPVGRVIKWI